MIVIRHSPQGAGVALSKGRVRVQAKEPRIVFSSEEGSPRFSFGPH